MPTIQPIAGELVEFGATGVRRFLAGSVALHALVGALLFAIKTTGSPELARAARANAALVQQQIQQTEVREMQRRVRRLGAIQEQMAAAADPSAKSSDSMRSSEATSPGDLGARAEAMSAAIDAAERQFRARELSRLTGMSAGEAERQLEANTRVTEPPPGRPETPLEKIARMDQRAQQILQRTRAQLDTHANGVQVKSAAVAHRSGVQPTASSQLPGEPMAKQVTRGDQGGRDNALSVKGVAGVASDQRRHNAAGSAASGSPPGRSGDQHNPSRHTIGGELARQEMGVDATSTVAAGRSGLPALQSGESHDLVSYVRPERINSTSGPRAGGRIFGHGGAFAGRVYLDSWYVLGPFQGQGSKRSMQTVYPPEEAVDLGGSYRGKDARLLIWNYSSRGFHPFLFQEPSENAVYFAYTEIRIDEDQDVWLALAADDDAMLWLDGRLVWTSAPGDKPWYHVPFYVPHERSANLALAEGYRHVHLKRGIHRLLAKVYNKKNHAFLSVVVIP